MTTGRGTAPRPAPRMAAAVLLLLLSLAARPTDAKVDARGQPQGPPPKSDRVIVKLGVPPDDAPRAGRDVAQAAALNYVQDLGDGFVVLEAKGNPSRAQAGMLKIRAAADKAKGGGGGGGGQADDTPLGRAVAAGKVESAEEDFIVLPQAVASQECNETACSGLWGMNAINAPQAWAKVSTAIAPSSASIAGSLIDTGVQYNHVELSEQFLPNAGISYKRGVPSGDGSDNDGHGTHVTGTMAAKWGGAQGGIAGVNGRAQIASCKFLYKSGGYTSDAIMCIQYLSKNVSAQAVINNSWGGGGYSSALHFAIRDYVCKQDGLFVAAAGNSASDVVSSGFFPAAYVTYPGAECVLPVAAVDENLKLASFSNFGSAVPIAAPGVNIRSSVWSARSTSAEATYSGTSMAAPHVSGVALLLRNQFPKLTAMQIKDILIKSATAGVVKNYGTNSIAGGLLNAEAAYEAAYEKARQL